MLFHSTYFSFYINKREESMEMAGNKALNVKINMQVDSS